MSQQSRTTFVLIEPNEILQALVGLKDVRVVHYRRREREVDLMIEQVVDIVLCSALDQAGSAADGEARLRALVGQLEHDYPSAAACLAEDLPALSAHLNYPLQLRKRLCSTNLLERLLGEVKRRTRVIGRFLARPADSASAGRCSTSSSPAREVSVSQISRVVSSTNCAPPSAQN